MFKNKLAIDAAHLALWDYQVETVRIIYIRYWAECFDYKCDEIILHMEGRDKLLHPDVK